MKKYYLLLFFSLLLGQAVSAQSIINIIPHITGNSIIVDYRLTGTKFYQKFDASLYVSLDNGLTWEGPLQKVSGDIGKDISPGTNRIVWDVLNEIPVLDKEFIFDIRIEARDEGIKRQVFIQYTGNLITPLGARIGILGKTGFYIEARTSALSAKNVEFDYTGDFIDDYEQEGYYSFGQTAGYHALSVTGGLTFQLGWSTFFYIGAGYGTQKYIIELDQYEYNNNSPVSTAWAASTAASYTGAEVATGLIFKPGNFIISIGTTALNFEVFNFTAGIGMAF